VPLPVGVRKTMPSEELMNWQSSILLYSVQVLELTNSIQDEEFSNKTLDIVVPKEFSTLIVALIRVKPDIDEYFEVV
jgi:hypothetical protein